MPRISEIVLPDALVTAARAGELAALAAVYTGTADAIYTLLRRLVRRPAIAEELLQETFLDVLEHIGAFEGRCPLPAWIRAIAVNRALMYLRSPWHRGLEWLDKDPGGTDRLPATGCDPHEALDDRLSRVTLEPNAPERSERLWRERVDILYSLVQVRYADAVGT